MSKIDNYHARGVNQFDYTRRYAIITDEILYALRLEANRPCCSLNAFKDWAPYLPKKT